MIHSFQTYFRKFSRKCTKQPETSSVYEAMSMVSCTFWSYFRFIISSSGVGGRILLNKMHSSIHVSVLTSQTSQPSLLELKYHKIFYGNQRIIVRSE